MTKSDCKDFVKEAERFMEVLNSMLINELPKVNQTPWEAAAYFPAIKIAGSLRRLIETCKED